MHELESALLADEAFTRAVLPAVTRLQRLSAPVVVGVGADGSGASALDWAAAEAAGQRRPLRIVHAYHLPMAVVDPFGVALTADCLSAQQAAAAQLLDVALARVRSVAPGVRASASVVRGSPHRVLLRESRGAHLLVLGARRRARRHGLVQAPLHLRVATSACCPVTVVHPSRDAGADRLPPRVVVGIDGLEHSDAAIGFAFRAAARRGIPVTAVHAWTADCPADLEAVTAPLVTTESGAHALVDGAVARWRELYPDVPVTTEVVRRDPVSALVTGSADAALVVVGSRGSRGGLATLFGSVGRAVIDVAAGPVAVVPRGTGSSPPAAHRWASG
ncbi:universal stress protein [Geodermatophilus sp. DSM 45219]|uniref:universal stress protein n=1 Tax=Geodermatophilus sp. DSM 45219 TaxID=1881103 RepID=UPI0015A2CFEC|nr:universal stress protein [Geodermatophilus sp. DSM 45219]